MAEYQLFGLLRDGSCSSPSERTSWRQESKKFRTNSGAVSFIPILRRRPFQIFHRRPLLPAGALNHRFSATPLRRSSPTLVPASSPLPSPPPFQVCERNPRTLTLCFDLVSDASNYTRCRPRECPSIPDHTKLTPAARARGSLGIP